MLKISTSFCLCLVLYLHVYHTFAHISKQVFKNYNNILKMSGFFSIFYLFQGMSEKLTFFPIEFLAEVTVPSFFLLEYCTCSKYSHKIRSPISNDIKLKFVTWNIYIIQRKNKILSHTLNTRIYTNNRINLSFDNSD